MAVKQKRLLIVVCAAALAVGSVPAVHSGLGDFLKKASEGLKKSRSKKRAKKRRRSTATAAVRGIGCASAEVDEAARNEDARDFDGLESLRRFIPSETQLRRFLKEGRLAR